MTEDLSCRIRREALETLEAEPELRPLLYNTVLAPGVESFEDAVAYTIAFRLLDPQTNFSDSINGDNNNMSSSIDPKDLRRLFVDAIHNKDMLEGGHTMAEAAREDVLAVIDRDPACETLLEVVLFFKGFAAVVGHRVARQKWLKRKHSMTALFLQSKCSANFGMDIHPAATIGSGVLLDHGTGIVIGETAVIGDGSTLLHGVTLGGTGKEEGDRHPKVGKACFIGAGASILGNIQIGDCCKIGAGSIVLRPLPPRATAVGAPAKIIGRALEDDPGRNMDRSLSDVALLHKSSSLEETTSTTEEETSTSSSSDHVDDFVAAINTRQRRDQCPFRRYTTFAKRAPPGTITIVTLRKLLLPEGCNDDEIGFLFFALDTNNVGYIYRDKFEEVALQAIKEHTSLQDEKRIQEILTKFFANHPISLDECGKKRGSHRLSLPSLKEMSTV